MKTHITPNPVADSNTSVAEQLAKLRRLSRGFDPAIEESAAAYWAADDEMTALLERYHELKCQRDAAEARHKLETEQKAEIDAEADVLQQYIDDLEASVKCRDAGHKSRRKHKKFQRRAACQHRANGLASLSDATHVMLVLKGRRKARRDRDYDKGTDRPARKRRVSERGLNPAEILPLPVKRRERATYYAELEESRRIATIAACTDPALVAANLNGECHDHYA